MTKQRCIATAFPLFSTTTIKYSWLANDNCRTISLLDSTAESTNRQN